MELSEEKDYIVYDLQAAYGLDFVKELKREFIYERSGDGRIIVRDYFSLTQPGQFEMALITYANVVYDRDLMFYGDVYGLRVTLPDVPYSIVFETLEPCLIAGADTTAQPKRIGIRFQDDAREGTFAISVTPFRRLTNNRSYT